MAKHAVRVAVRNVVRVIAAPQALVAAKARVADRQARPPAGNVNTPELLSGVSWDEGRKVWLVHPLSLPVRG
ncbi:hypothetical protein CHU95_08480 [Niveispirillum lacus]|uniref:Uncharacterized protein n=1 Tax=Niveispirillum lacus TaxID=1981099 RepID=A0A255Z1C0_9PROT|nr:hypothetical protein [Niveispirillum lacus]OYQ35252.1 hypothetical protein CHU95_08480 [Niveispirillum lacus]